MAFILLGKQHWAVSISIGIVYRNVWWNPIGLTSSRLITREE